MFGGVSEFDNDANIPSNDSRQTFNIKDLSTRSVVLYPTRAHITRDVDNLVLKPGTNEVELVGLSPTVDEHSIQIEARGPGSVTIADMSVQLVPNHDIYEEIYPSNEDTDPEYSENDGDYRDSDDEPTAVQLISKELRELKLRLSSSIETQNSANERLATWDKYTKTIASEHISSEHVSKLLQKYSEDRSKIYEAHSSAAQDITRLKKQIKRKENEKLKAGREYAKHKEKEGRERQKVRQRKARQREERKKQAKYLKQERLRYWPKKVFKIMLMLELSNLDTPNSSRRASVDSVTLASSFDGHVTEQSFTAQSPSDSQVLVPITLSYVTREAGWSPRYDVRISSRQKTATIIYRTEFLNRTSETWKDAKLSFSTSQTSYQGLGDIPPVMHAWRIKLSRDETGDGGLLSDEECLKPRSGRPGFNTFDRASVFGLDDYFIPAMQAGRPLQIQQYSKSSNLFGSNQGPSLFGGKKTNDTYPTGSGLFGNLGANNTNRPPGGGGLFGDLGAHNDNNSNSNAGSAGLFGNSNGNNNNEGAGGLFGSVKNTNIIAEPPSETEKPVAAVASGGLFGTGSTSNAGGTSSFGIASAAFASLTSNTNAENNDRSGASIERARKSSRFANPLNATVFKSRKKSTGATGSLPDDGEVGSVYLENEDGDAEYGSDSDSEGSAWEDNGLTTTYDTPGLRTLAPSSLTRRNKLATLNATNINLSHICVPKLRSAAFLRAKIRNPSSSITLLKGSAGVTLDGSFLGNMNLPRVSPNQLFDLSLGVDPGIQVSYPKPSVHRSTQGMVFSKESAQVFSRSVWVNNTKSQPVDLEVTDQIPVSEDERLKILILNPKGLGKEGDEVKAGVGAKEGNGGAVTEKSGNAWGNAKARLRRNGEINWRVHMEKGQGCLLKLDYEARLPPSEKIVPA